MPSRWLARIRESTVRFGTVQIETRDGHHFFQIQVLRSSLLISNLKVELYASPVRAGDVVIETMTACGDCTDSKGSITYSAQLPATRAAGDYTPRIVPHHPGISVPLEAEQILWQR